MKRSKSDERAIILMVAKQVRKEILKETTTGTSLGMCYEASLDLRRELRKRGIRVKIKQGVFRVDYDQCGDPTDEPSHDEAHFWAEWQGIPIDVTADQFNWQLKVKNRVKAIVFGTDLDRYLSWKFKPVYVS